MLEMYLALKVHCEDGLIERLSFTRMFYVVSMKGWKPVAVEGSIVIERKGIDSGFIMVMARTCPRCHNGRKQ